MIFIERGRVAVPAALGPAVVQAAYERARAHFRDAGRGQERFHFGGGTERAAATSRRSEGEVALFEQEDVRAALRELFYGKCAFCESPVAPKEGRVAHFRPLERTVAADGSVLESHYWWLAYEWENLHLSCPACLMMKGSRFPIGGPRATREAGSGELAAEMPLLLDPCRDRPEAFLIFQEDGTVSSDRDEGRTTIATFGLNRRALVVDRMAALAAARATWEGMVQGDPDAPDAEGFAAPEHPFAGMRRQFFQSWLEAADAGTRARLEPAAGRGLVDAAPPSYSSGDRAESKGRYESYDQTLESYSLEDPAGSEAYYARTRLIERIEIENYRSIESLTLEAQSWHGERAAWLMMLGENGTGKSSVLQAVALTLAGDAYRERLGVTADEVLRRGTQRGRVRIYLTGSPEPIEMRFGEGVEGFQSSAPEPKVLLLAYGATRLLPRPGVAAAVGAPWARLDNLFNPFVPLEDAAAWLAAQPAERFDGIARGLKGLLDLGRGERLVREDGRIEAEAFGTRLPLAQLSDGYQSVLALAADIMAVMGERWSSMEVAEGIVLIDEIGAHLHPRWKMRIVERLRALFPRVQVIASTHNPLCLRGLDDDEVVVMRRDGQGRVVAITDLPPISGMRVDQLLTSEHFGLNSTLDPAIEAMFERYYALLAAHGRTAEEEVELAALKEEMAGLDLLGQTRRERLMLEAVDDFLAVEPELSQESRSALKEETKRTVTEMWQRVVRQGEEP